MDQLITLTAFAFYGLALLSMFAHAVKKWTKGELRGSVADWFIGNPRATVGAAMAALGGVAAAILGGQLTDLHNGAQLLAVFGIGYMADSGLNSQEPKQ